MLKYFLKNYDDSIHALRDLTKMTWEKNSSSFCSFVESVLKNLNGKRSFEISTFEISKYFKDPVQKISKVISSEQFHFHYINEKLFLVLKNKSAYSKNLPNETILDCYKNVPISITVLKKKIGCKVTNIE